MNTAVVGNKGALVKNKQQDYLLYAALSIFLIFLGLVSLKTITLSRPLLLFLGIIAVGAVFILAFADLRKLLLIFVLYLPFSRILLGDFGTEFWAFNLTNIFLVFIILSIAIEKLKSNISLVPKSSVSIPILLFCLFGVASFVRSGFYFGYTYLGNFLSPLKEWLMPMLLFFIFFVAIKDKRDIKQLAMLIIFITVCISALVVFEYLKLKWLGREEIRVGTIFEQPNRAGAFFVYYGFLLVGFFLVNIRSFKYWSLILPILISARALMYTYSRGALLAFACAGFFIAFVKNKLIFILLCLFTIFALFSPGILPSSLYERFSSTFTEGDYLYQNSLQERLEPSAGTRLIIWKGAINIIKDHPVFGIGYGVFPYLIPFYAPVGHRDAHNTYLIVGAELGLFGLGVFLWILALIFKNTWFVYRKSQDKFIRALALGFLAGIVGLLVCNIFGSRLDSQELTGFFWILTALIFKSKELIKKGQLI